MADKRISELTALPVEYTGNELLAVVQDGVTYRGTSERFLTSNITVRERFIPFVSSNDPVLTQVVNSINASTPQTIVPNGVLQLFSFIQWQGGVFGTEFVKTVYQLKRGAGTYGAGGTTLTTSDVILYNVQNTVGTVIPLGDIGSNPIEDFVNGAGPYVITGLTIFTATISAVDKVYVFSGANGTYGDGATQTTSDNFIDVSGQNIPSVGLNAFAPRFISLDGVDTEQEELFWVSEAAALSATNLYGGTITCNQGEQIVFFCDLLNGTGVERRFYALNSGATVFDAVTSPYLDLTPLGRLTFSLTDNPLVVDLGDIDDADVWTAFNADASEPFEMNNDRFVIAETDTGDKVWKWVGGSGSFGDSATPAVASDFVDLTAQSEVAGDDLPPLVINTDTYTVVPTALNRLLVFTENDTTVTIDETLAELAASEGILSPKFRAIFQGTGTHTVNAYNGVSETFSQGAVVVCELIGNGTEGWYVKELGGATPTLQEVTDEGNTTDNELIVTDVFGTDPRTIYGSGSINSKAFSSPGGYFLNKEGLFLSDKDGNETDYLIGYLKDKIVLDAQMLPNPRGTYKFPDLGAKATENTLATIEQFTDAPTEAATSLIGLNGDGDVVQGNEVEEPIIVTGIRFIGNLGFQSLFLVGGYNPTASNPLYATIIGQGAGFGGATASSNVVYIGANAGSTNTHENVIIIAAGGQGTGTFASGEYQVVYRMGAKFVSLDFNAITNNIRRTFTFQNKSGTVALLEDFTDAPTEPATSLLGLNGDGEVVQTPRGATPDTGAEIDFTTPKIFNSPASPETGNITDDLTDALIGIVQKIYHNHTTEPTFPAGWVLVGGAYVESELNIIYAEWVSGTRVEYWIAQEI